MPTHQEIYARHADEYEALVSHEDHQGNILRALDETVRLSDLDVVDLGSGTGRLACLLAPRVRHIAAFDLSLNMLQIARKKLGLLRDSGWIIAVADHRRLPLGDRSADLVVSGWSVSYVAIWHPDTWRQEAQAWLDEVRRVLRPRGHVILLESLGTGVETPQRLPHLENFYGWLDEQDFASRWIRTDYRFESRAVAEQLTGFFFGDELKSRIQEGPTITLPECTGVWWKRL